MMLLLVNFFYQCRFHYAPDFNADFEIKKGLYETIEKMCSTPELRATVDRQLDMFHNAEKMFGMSMAIQMRDKKPPGKDLIIALSPYQKINCFG